MSKSTQTAVQARALASPLDRLPVGERRFLERLFKKVRGHLTEPGRAANAKFTSAEMLCLFPELKEQLAEADSNPDHPSNQVLELGLLRFQNINGLSGKGLRKSSAEPALRAIYNPRSRIGAKSRKSSMETAKTRR